MPLPPYECEYCCVHTHYYRQPHNCPDPRFRPYTRTYALRHTPTLAEQRLRIIRRVDVDILRICQLENPTEEDLYKLDLLIEYRDEIIKELAEIRAARRMRV